MSAGAIDAATQPLPAPADWSFALLQQYHDAIAEVAAGFGLDTRPNQIEIISAGQMMDAYASTGMPVLYRHWSFGKDFVATEQRYRRGQMGLAYEIVINSDPCISYLMEENSLAMQALVIAHAAFGHNSFFKGNALFRMWTDPGSIVDRLVHARDTIAAAEARHGADAVERLLDACHALAPHGVDRYRRPGGGARADGGALLRGREACPPPPLDDLWRTLPRREAAEVPGAGPGRFPAEPQENLLHFIELHAPLLQPWQREIVRIVRELAQYFLPQRQTQVMNEGWATFWHHLLLTTLHARGRLADGLMLECLAAHSQVIAQPPTAPGGRVALNPYALGFAMFRDIRRICEQPTDEDRAWFPQLAGRPWLEALDEAMRHYKDESFVGQFLSPALMRGMRLYAVLDDERQSELEVSAIHDEAGYRRLRAALARQLDLGAQQPDIQVWDAQLRGSRALTLRHFQQDERPLHDDAQEVLRHVALLWGFEVRLDSVDALGEVTRSWRAQAPPEAA